MPNIIKIPIWPGGIAWCSSVLKDVNTCTFYTILSLIQSCKVLVGSHCLNE